MSSQADQIRAARPCDCLNHCGDDPWLHDGRATPCEGRKQALAAKEERTRTRDAAKALLGIAQEDGQVVVSLANMAALCNALRQD